VLLKNIWLELVPANSYDQVEYSNLNWCTRHYARVRHARP